VIIKFGKSSSSDDYQLYMRGELTKAEQIKLISLRNEASYDADPEPEAKALRLLADSFDASKLKVSFLWASDSTEKSSAVRLKKFSIAARKVFGSYKREDHEVFVDNSNSRLISAVELDDFTNKPLPNEVLHSATGLFVVSSENKYIEINDQLVSKEYSSSAFDIRRLLDLFGGDSDVCLMRYFPADNGRDESISLIGQENSFLVQRLANSFVK
jgi:hypothetical protein